MIDAAQNKPDLRDLLRKAICDFIEPMVISHLSQGTEWREEANKFILECAPLVFGPNESVFGQPPPGIIDLSGSGKVAGHDDAVLVGDVHLDAVLEPAVED